MFIHVKQYTILGEVYATFHINDILEAVELVRICIRNDVPVHVTYSSR